jgi:hypothetical protein
MSKLSDLIQQARNGKRISEMLPIDGLLPARGALSPLPPDELTNGLAFVEQLLIQNLNLDTQTCRLFSSELEDIADLLR